MGSPRCFPRLKDISAGSWCCRFTAGPARPAIRVLVRASKGSRAPFVLLPGLALNDEEGRPTAEAEAVLRGGEGLPLGEP